MSFDQQTLYQLLPAIYRIRDAALGDSGQDGPIKALVSVIAQQAQVMEEDLAQLYDDLFIETCAPWVIPYIGELIGVRSLDRNSVLPGSTRAEIANTLRYRRAKGTLAVLEDLAQDVTGWEAHAVEYFQLLTATQCMNHLRPASGALLSVRNQETLERINTPFDRIPHSVDVRDIKNGRRRFNVPNVGIFLWRLRSFSLTDVPAFPVDAHRFLFNPLGIQTQLFNLPETRSGSLNTPFNVPEALSRRLLNSHLDRYYGSDKSIFLVVDNHPVQPGPAQRPSDLVTVCDLSDFGAGWAHVPKNKIAIDPELGRIAFPTSQSPATVKVAFHYGSSAELGGGEYPRVGTFDSALTPIHQIQAPVKIQDGLNGLSAGGVLEIIDNSTYSETLSLAAGIHRFAVRAKDGRRPLLRLPGNFTISGEEQAEVTLNGLVLAGTIHVTGNLSRLNLTHCTILPSAASPSLIVESGRTTVEIDHSILGTVQTVDSTSVNINSSILDAAAENRVAFSALDNNAAGGVLDIRNSTIIGKIHSRELKLVSNSILIARLNSPDTWIAPVLSERRQEGCVRFSFLPFESITPRRFRCQPATANDATRVRPQFNSIRYGDAAYCQLSIRCAVEILSGADDGAEIGAFHDLLQPQRRAHLRLRLDEYLRFGLQAGITDAT
jgi:hypothetical protein